MTKMFTAIALLFAGLSANGQTTSVPVTETFGKIKKEDLELKNCDFEKDASAMVLFNKGSMYYNDDFSIVVEHHKRIKIFSEAGKKQGDIRIEYYGGNRFETITDIQAQVFNLRDGVTEVTKLDKKTIFIENIDKLQNAVVFSFPNVKAGSVVEYKYTETINSLGAIPDWFFQEKIPVRYSEFTTLIPEYFYFSVQQRVYTPFTVNEKKEKSRTIPSIGRTPMMFNETQHKLAMANVVSAPDEPFMTSVTDNMQAIYHHLTRYTGPSGFTRSYSDSWAKVGGILADDEDFGMQLKKKLSGEELIIAKAKALKTEQEKIIYLFNEVKANMKWNGIDRWYTNDGTNKSWEKKTGNSAEVNLVLYHLLKQSGVKAYPMVVSTRSHGKVNPAFSFLYQFNRAVVYIPVDSAKSYILDATSKYNTYSTIPSNLLNSYGLFVDKENKIYDLVFLKNTEPVRSVVMVMADIKPEGTMEGKVQISGTSYARLSSVEEYKEKGEKKYLEDLKKITTGLDITSLQTEGLDVDTVPFVQNIDFKMELSGSDKEYIYFNPNLMSSFGTNPFLSENRTTDIDLGHNDTYIISGFYKLPAGFKTETLPKSVVMSLPDDAISFKRYIEEKDGSVEIRYLINYKKSLFFKEDYEYFYGFYKKMFELINEQIVLKKS
ncbi:DUF3857 domain-containing protein [Pedobacter sp. HMF7647]|uniref:DUF3857 domain-containing protein n=1 Tax=Hufsiella arboris TaxID=2695275 RepID=A0A7K1YCP9_9SPHI|nr:DUF3857 domain-containing protein [Hufsiella arboris]MXV52356.1 DUF3857 domain-containing protein [Hufsiella arboris]